MSPVTLLSAALLLAAAQQAALQQAIDLYWNGEYERTLQLLGSVLDANELVEGHKYRAFSLVALERNDEVRAEFTALLELDPSHALDTALVSPKIVEQFELARQDFSASLFERGKAAYFEGRYDGAYDLSENPDDASTTVLDYELEVDLIVPLPGFVKRRAEARIIKAALPDLKDYIESGQAQPS